MLIEVRLVQLMIKEFAKLSVRPVKEGKEIDPSTLFG